MKQQESGNEPSAIGAVRHPEMREARERVLETYKTAEIGVLPSGKSIATSIVPNMIAAVHQSTARTKTPERDALGADVSKVALGEDF